MILLFKISDLGRYHEVEDTVFVNCTFDKVVFHLNLLKQLSFLNCRFYECRYTSDTATPTLKFYNCVAEPSDFLDRFSPQNSEEILQANGFNSCELYILEKFWPRGRETFYKHRPISILTRNNKDYKYDEMVDAIRFLHKQDILITPDRNRFLELNIEKIPSIKSALGKSQ